jgi:hypothetical protein
MVETVSISTSTKSAADRMREKRIATLVVTGDNAAL